MAGIIEVRPQDLDTKAAQIRQHAQKIQAAIDAVDTDINSLNASQFEGNRATDLRTRYRRYSDYLRSFKPMVERFAIELEQAATKFRIADK
jgi:WXG100 family type VII secretion target